MPAARILISQGPTLKYILIHVPPALGAYLRNARYSFPRELRFAVRPFALEIIAASRKRDRKSFRHDKIVIMRFNTAVRAV